MDQGKVDRSAALSGGDADWLATDQAPNQACPYRDDIYDWWYFI